MLLWKEIITMHYRILKQDEPVQKGDEYWTGIRWDKVVTMFGFPAPITVQIRRPIQSKTKKIAPALNCQRVVK